MRTATATATPRPWGRSLDLLARAAGALRGKALEASLILVALGGGTLRLWRLGSPPLLIGDEPYYAKDACWHALASPSTCGIATEQTWVHPPLGKSIIGVGIQLFGYSPIGWRVAAAVIGTLAILVFFLLAHQLLGAVPAAVASILLALDPLHFVQSRTAMLDIFAAFFSLLAVLFIVYDKDAVDSGRGLLRQRWLLAAGFSAGLAMACKWSGGLALVVVMLLALLWRFRARGRQAGGPLIPMRVRAELVWVAAGLVVLPITVYAASFYGNVGGTLLSAPWSEVSWWRNLWERHADMAEFHVFVDRTSTYQSPAWSWLLMKRPISYLKVSDGANIRQVLATGSIAMWGLSVAAFTYALITWLRDRAPKDARLVVVIGFAITYGFWLLPWERPAVYLFYVLPALPFLYLASGWVISQIRARRERAAVAVAVVALAAITFWYHEPILTGGALSRSEWRSRLGPFVACDVAADSNQGSSLRSTRAEHPPAGWCWI